MKDSRIGESLWMEWDGEGYSRYETDSRVFYTNDHVDVENELVRRALASSIQRDGLADSLAESFRYLDASTVSYGWAGFLESDIDLFACNEDGMTEYEDLVDLAFPITWVEF